MNEHERDRIAAAMNQARPDWPTRQLRTLLDSPQLVDRPRRDVFVALAWVASEAGTATPYRVLEAGPWWKAAAIDATTSSNRDNPEPHERCSVCSLSEGRCRQVWANDHDFEPATIDRKLPADAISSVVSELRDRLEPTVTPAPAREHTPNPNGPAARAKAAVQAEQETTT